MVLHVFLSFLLIFSTSKSIVLAYSSVFCVFPSYMTPETGTSWSSVNSGWVISYASKYSGTLGWSLASVSWYLVTSRWALVYAPWSSISPLAPSAITSYSTNIFFSTFSLSACFYSLGYLQLILCYVDQERKNLLLICPLFQHLQNIFQNS